MIEPLTKFINVYFVKEEWPDELNMAEVVPLPKSKEKYKSTNYRPISLISNLPKILQQILLKFINKCNIVQTSNSFI